MLTNLEVRALESLCSMSRAVCEIRDMLRDSSDTPAEDSPRTVDRLRGRPVHRLSGCGANRHLRDLRAAIGAERHGSVNLLTAAAAIPHCLYRCFRKRYGCLCIRIIIRFHIIPSCVRFFVFYYNIVWIWLQDFLRIFVHA